MKVVFLSRQQIDIFHKNVKLFFLTTDVWPSVELIQYSSWKFHVLFLHFPFLYKIHIWGKTQKNIDNTNICICSSVILHIEGQSLLRVSVMPIMTSQILSNFVWSIVQYPKMFSLLSQKTNKPRKHHIWGAETSLSFVFFLP